MRRLFYRPARSRRPRRDTPGNYARLPHDSLDVDCDTCREALSARLDEESPPVPTEHMEQHLAYCSACRSWEQRARDLSRSLRLRPVHPVPDVSRSVVTAAACRPCRPARWPRVLLACVAVCQIAFGASQLTGLSGSHGGHTERMLTAGHLFNESTAWNLALGLGLLWCVYRVRASAGLVPVLSAFLAVLTGFCAVDFANSAVSVSRLAAHGLLVLGLVCLLLVHRSTIRQWSQPTSEEPRTSESPHDVGDTERRASAGDRADHHKPLPPAGFRRAG